jgi:DNA mismatch repair protein MutS2
VRVGDKVLVQQFGALGEVISVQNGQVEVQLGRFRTTVPLAAVELRERAAQAADVAPRYAEPEVESPGLELDLRGQVSEEALINLDRYLDQAFMARLPWVRIIHGRGSGALRRVVRDELQRHPLVGSYQAGDEGEGGEGVTVAKLVQG